MALLYDSKSEGIADNTFKVRLFGPFELKTHYASITEPPGAEQLLFRLLKYMLIEPARESTPEDFISKLDQAETSTASDKAATLRVYLHRLDALLQPLDLNNAGALVQLRSGKCYLIPAYTINRDMDRFVDLMSKLDRCKLDSEKLKIFNYVTTYTISTLSDNQMFT